ncbi:MAG: hypothetical protein HOP22_12630 [Nitrospiraceae bacterium]|nr:hypothetical protein [Nitrospiraceae bacterium]
MPIGVLCGWCNLLSVECVGTLTRIIREGFCGNRRYAAATSLAAGGLVPRSVGILVGTGTAADGGASPLASAHPSRLASCRFRREPS